MEVVLGEEVVCLKVTRRRGRRARAEGDGAVKAWWSNWVNEDWRNQIVAGVQLAADVEVSDEFEKL